MPNRPSQVRALIMPRILPISCCVALALGLVACGVGPMVHEDGDPAARAASADGMPAIPEFSIESMDGGSVTNADIEGRVVLVNFWATWCGPCKIEMPWFVDFQRKFKDRGFTVLAISLDEGGWDPVREFAQDHDFNFPVLLGDDAVSEDFGGIYVLPTTWIVSRQGKVVFTHQGLVAKAKYEEEIEALLAGSA